MGLQNKTDHLAEALLKPINPAAIIILGIYTVLWGLWVVNPFWSVFSTAPLFSALGALLPEWFWGSLAILCGSATTYGAVRRSYNPLHRGAIIACWHWTMIGIFYFIGDWMNTGGITALTFGVYAGFIWLNIRVNRRFIDKDEDLFVK